jgi:hypothetical protein
MENSVVTYPVPAAATLSGIYTVTVGGTSVPVEQFCEFHHAHFAFTGECEVVIAVKPSIGERNLKYIHRYSVLPRRREPCSSSELNTIKLKLTQPTKLIIQVNEYERLILFADLIDADAPKLGDRGVVNVAEFATDNTGAKVQTAQIQKAIAAVPKNGVLFFPAGVYRSGRVDLKSDMTLYLAGGAVLKASDNPADFPRDDASPYWSNWVFLNLPAASNVTVRGHGVLDGNGTVLRGNKGVAHLLIARDGKNVTVRDIHVRDAAAWTLHAINCEDIAFRNVKMINNFDVQNTDGIDPTSCRRMVVEDCFVHSSDDGVVVKSFNGVKCDDIMVRGNIVFDRKSALKIGTETEGDISNVSFVDNDVVLCDRGMAIYVQDGAEVRDTKFIGNHFEECIPDLRRSLIDFYTWNRKGGGKVLGVLIKDCAAEKKWPRPSTFFNGWGIIDGVRFENFTLEGKVCRSLREADLVIMTTPDNDSRKPGVKNVSFSPAIDNKKAWNPAIVDLQ